MQSAVEYLLYQNLVGAISHLDIYLPSANQIAGFVTTMIYKIHAYRDARCNHLTISTLFLLLLLGLILRSLFCDSQGHWKSVVDALSCWQYIWYIQHYILVISSAYWDIVHIIQIQEVDTLNDTNQEAIIWLIF